MPEEPISDVETYPPLPARTQGRNLPMPDSGAQETPPTPDAQAAPSAEEATQEESTPSETQATEQAPPQQAEPEATDVPFHKHPRWQEIQQEREELRRQRDEAQRLAELAVMRSQPQPAPQQHRDPWEGLVNHPDPATAQFYQQQRTLIQHERQLAKQEAIAELQPVIQAGTQEIARLNTSQFRRENPEIKPGSEEERQIVAYMNGQMDGVRHTLESAKRNAMYGKLELENRALKSKQAAVPRKAAANVESSAGIPERSGLPGRPGDWRQQAGEMLDKGGDIRDVASMIFGGKRKT